MSYIEDWDLLRANEPYILIPGVLPLYLDIAEARQRVIDMGVNVDDVSPYPLVRRWRRRMAAVRWLSDAHPTAAARWAILMPMFVLSWDDIEGSVWRDWLDAQARGAYDLTALLLSCFWDLSQNFTDVEGRERLLGLYQRLEDNP